MTDICKWRSKAASHITCCICLPSFLWFRFLAWIQFLLIAINLFGTVFKVDDRMNKFAEYNIRNDNGQSLDVDDLRDFDPREIQDDSMVPLVLAAILDILSIVSILMFIVCDSTKPRQVYAISFILGAISIICYQGFTKLSIPYALFCLYWAEEMAQLVELVDD